MPECSLGRMRTAAAAAPVRTQGGRRPAQDVVLRDLVAVVRRRSAALRRWADGEPLATICADFECGRASLFRTRTRFDRDGLEGLLDGPRGGRRSSLPATIERLILTVWRLTCWNSQQLAAEFRRRGLGRLVMARSTASSRARTSGHGPRDGVRC